MSNKLVVRGRCPALSALSSIRPCNEFPSPWRGRLHLPPAVRAPLPTPTRKTLHNGSGLRCRSLNGLTQLPQAASGGVDGAIVATEAVRVVLDSLFRDGFASTRRTIDSLAKARIALRRVA